jgi:hypothetical protein
MVWICALALCVAHTAQAADDRRYPLPAPVTTIVTEGRGLGPLAAALQADAAATLEQALPPAEARRWLGLQVHLALLAGDDVRAQAAANRLRELQPDPNERAYTGLTTAAVGAARRADGSVDQTVFARDLARRLRELPKTPAMRAVLVRQRERLAAIAPAPLRAAAEEIERRTAGATTLDWTTADEVVRLRHRWADLLPLVDALRAALDEAIAGQPV